MRAIRRFAFVLVASIPALCPAAGVLGEMTGVAPGPANERNYDASVLRPTELKSCLVDAYSIDTTDALFEMERPRVEKEREELNRMMEAASGKGPGDPASSALRAKAKAFNARVAALNSQVAYATEARDRFSKTCKGRKYYFPDVQLVRGELPAEISSVIPPK